MKNYNNDEIIRFFEDAGYNNVEIIGNRLLFTTGEDVIFVRSEGLLSENRYYNQNLIWVRKLF